MRAVTRLLIIASAMMAFVLIPATAGAADLNATPSNFTSQFAAAQGGDRVLLASGSYGSWNPTAAKSSNVTVEPQSGASVTFGGVTWASSVRNVTFRGATLTSPMCVNVPSGAKMNLVLDGLKFGSMGTGCNEGRLGFKGPGTNSVGGAGVQVMNSTFGPNGCSDGIQDSSHGVEIGPGNEFKGIVQGSCSAHSDPIQPYDGDYAWIHDNWIHDNEQGIMSPDGLSTGYKIENNVINMNATGYYCMHMGHTTNGSIRHNVCLNGGVRLYGGNEGVPSANMTVTDNAASVDNISCTNCTVNHNQTVTFTGGAGRCGYATASPKGTATDGTDIGLNDCGGTPPPPNPACSDGADNDGDGFTDYPADAGCTSASDDDETDPIGPPPTDHTPVAAFTDSPDPSAPQQTVTFDATSSTCEDAPCTYHWHDVGADGTGDWGLGPDGSTMSFAFQDTGTKYVELVVTDADGDVDKVMHPHEVSNTPPPPPTDNTPVARFTFSPSSPRRGQTVTFNATTSTCQDTPCTYHWHDVGSNGAGDWPLGPDGSTMTFAFKGAGTKYVELVLTDADGDISKVRHNVVVR